MRKNNLGFGPFLKGVDTYWVVVGERAYVGCEPRNLRSLHAAESHCSANDALLVHVREAGTCNNDRGEDHTRIRREGPDLGKFALVEAEMYPILVHDGNHVCLRLSVLWKIDRVGDDVGGSFQRKTTVRTRLAHLGPIVFHELGELSEMVKLARQP